jgi:uncharacterized membrane protein
MSSGALGVVAATFLAAGVEFVEALTIVLAMGVARSWRAALWGTAAAVAALSVLTVVFGVAVDTLVSRSALQLTVGTLLLIFGLQWLRQAVLRAAGLKDLHDEEATYAAEQTAALSAGTESRFGLDWYAFVVAFKGVFLEGLEVVFIVITFGASARSLPLAAAGALGAGLIVLAVGAIVHRPLARVPENTLKYIVGLLLSTFGLFWVVEGLGAATPDGQSLAWPGGDVALIVLLALWLVGSQMLIRFLRSSQRVSDAARAA